MKELLIIIMATIISTTLFSQNQKIKWILVATNNIGGKTFISSNIQSKTKGIIKLWNKDVNEMLDSITKLTYQSVNLIEVDCNNHRMKLDSGFLYDSTDKIISKMGIVKNGIK